MTTLEFQTEHPCKDTASHFLSLSPLERVVSNLNPSDSDETWLIAVFQILHICNAKDPTPIHFFIARETLKEEKIFDDRAVDILARELLICCQKMQKHFLSSLIEFDEGKTFSVCEEEGSVSLVEDSSPFSPEKEECNVIDFFFSEFIQTLGKCGAKAALAIQKNGPSRLNPYKSAGFESTYRPKFWSFWIQNNPEHLFLGPYLAILADVIWNDTCATIWSRKERNVPAFTYSVHPAVTKILSPKSETKTIEDQLYMMHEGKIVATLPTIDPKLIPAVTKGAGNLNSIYHHKLLRFECKSGFENWIHNKPDARVLRFERGCTEIAESLGLRSNRAIEEIKTLLVAQAYMHFRFDDGSRGNLIVLRKFFSPGCNREDGIEIVLGTHLLPHYTFQTSRRERLLIPVPQLPPLVSSTNYHAGQALLQMMVMEEFTANSVEFFETGSISIPQKRWEKFAKETQLPKSVFKQTLDRWIHDGDDGPCFLKRVEPNRYSLGPSYKKETDFLKYQGSLRKRRRAGGEKSALARDKKNTSLKKTISLP